MEGLDLATADRSGHIAVNLWEIELDDLPSQPELDARLAATLLPPVVYPR